MPIDLLLRTLGATGLILFAVYVVRRVGDWLATSDAIWPDDYRDRRSR